MASYSQVGRTEEYSGLKWAEIVGGVVVVIFAVVVLLVDYLGTTLNGYAVCYGTLASHACPSGYLINSNVLLAIGHFALALHLIFAAWSSQFYDQVYQHFRGFRWISHGIYMTFYIAAIGLLIPLPDYVTLFLVAILAGVGLGFAQSYNEAVNSTKEGDKKVISVLNSGKGSQWEGWLIGLAIVVTLVITFVLYYLNVTFSSTIETPSAAKENATVWIPIVAGSLYVVLHVVIAFITNWEWDTPVDAVGREIFFFVWELVFALFLQISIWVVLHESTAFVQWS